MRCVDESSDRHRLRATFDRVADLYDAARPSYPDTVFDDLVALGRVPPGGRVLEIGCGTGQATLPLARRGFEIVCVELGAALAEAARRKLAGFPHVRVVNARFEEWEPERELDAVVAFTAFHWVDPDARFAKPARILRSGGALAVVDTQHVRREGGDPFWLDVQEDYDAVVPHPDNRPSPLAHEVADRRAEMEATGLFRAVEVRQHLWDVTYTADEYVAVIATYSPNLVLDDATRARLFERIHRRIERQGTVTKTYLATLSVATTL
jgi:SAM-dependent methyltransferase